MKKTLSFMLIITLVLGVFALNVYSCDNSQLEKYIEGAFEARRVKDKLGNTILGSEQFTNPSKGGSSSASSTWTDWMAFAMARYSTADDDGSVEFKYDDGSGYTDYLNAMKDYITSAYSNNDGKLSAVKSTEWHRAIIAITALGGDPTHFGTYNGNSINLVADGTYNCLVSHGPSRQGINGVIFALISKNINDFIQPSEVRYTDDYFITYILQNQLPDGGWALSGTVSDPDVTAMAIQALTPYYASIKSYTYTSTKLNQSRTKTVRQAIDEGLSWLSDVQRDDGDYASWGTVNVESTAQVLVAVTGLGIDPDTDSRFVKNGHTLVDGLFKYRLSDGGFTHSYQGDSGNPDADPGKYNYMATDQAAYALVAYWRYVNHMNGLYDMRADVKTTETTTDLSDVSVQTTIGVDNTTQVSEMTTEQTTMEITMDVETALSTGECTTKIRAGYTDNNGSENMPQTGELFNKTVTVIFAAATLLGAAAIVRKKRQD